MNHPTYTTVSKATTTPERRTVSPPPNQASSDCLEDPLPDRDPKDLVFKPSSQASFDGLEDFLPNEELDELARLADPEIRIFSPLWEKKKQP